MNRVEYLELLTRTLTAFPTFPTLINADGGYRPSLHVSDAKHGAALAEIADTYDAAQTKRGDPRRAFRY